METTLSMLVDKAKLAQEDNAKRFLPEKSYFSPVAWARDLCTIHINIGRSSGKTGYILDNISQFDLAVFKTPETVRDVKTYLGGEVQNVHTLFTLFRTQIGRKLNYKYVYVENPSQVFARENSLYEFYYFISAKSPDSIYVFLGD